MQGPTLKPGRAPNETVSDCATVIGFEEKRQRGRPPEWTDEKLKTLRLLFDEGLSHSLIAKALETSRGAISSKLAALGLVRGGWSGRGAVNLRKAPREPAETKTRKPASPPRTAFSGMALKVGGNRADAGLRKFSWED